jgi:hypothetical protein
VEWSGSPPLGKFASKLSIGPFFYQWVLLHSTPLHAMKTKRENFPHRSSARGAVVFSGRELTKSATRLISILLR